MRVRIWKDGRVTIPKKVREAKGWTAGTALMVELCDGGVVVRRVKADDGQPPIPRHLLR